MEASLPQVIATSFINVSLAWVVGALAARAWLTKVSADWRIPASRALYLLMPYALITCACALLFSLWSEAVVMADVPFFEGGAAFKEMLKSTHYGHAGLTAITAVVLALAGHLVLANRETPKFYAATIAVFVVLLGAARVSIGHAYEYGAFSLATAVELVHVLAMAMWAGIVFIAGWVALPIVSKSEHTAIPDRASFLNSLSDWATVALIAIVATGAYNAYRVLHAPADLFSFYGNVLLFKLAMVAIAILLGAYNKFFGLPGASAYEFNDNTSGLRRVITVLRVESVALFLAIVAAAVLTGSAPPA
ncbi:copper resistance D family protein [Oxalicibacterium solurbis]|uniref:Copper resistance protein D domain-containing protein n=1 Tax=Oxalicibacterium solurbis TaxID=69280 RepID=A0A8J3B6B5_9BURK|nr:CopD family protein [Oxalicibacterium solurbis]GGI55664.1 hypothetical protein GCM10011430_28380 [Oxalicibacterium solurbis]